MGADHDDRGVRAGRVADGETAADDDRAHRVDVVRRGERQRQPLRGQDLLHPVQVRAPGAHDRDVRVGGGQRHRGWSGRHAGRGQAGGGDDDGLRARGDRVGHLGVAVRGGRGLLDQRDAPSRTGREVTGRRTRAGVDDVGGDRVGDAGLLALQRGAELPVRAVGQRGVGRADLGDGAMDVDVRVRLDRIRIDVRLEAEPVEDRLQVLRALALLRRAAAARADVHGQVPDRLDRVGRAVLADDLVVVIERRRGFRASRAERGCREHGSRSRRPQGESHGSTPPLVLTRTYENIHESVNYAASEMSQHPRGPAY